MDNIEQDRQNAHNAVIILTHAAEAYIDGLTDKLSKALVPAQVSAALQIFRQLVDERFPAAEIVPAESEAPTADSAA